VNRATGRHLLLSALCGAAWGLLAVFAAGPHGNENLWGGLVASPFIGLGIGAATRRWLRLPVIARVFASLLSLTLAAAAFGLAVGLTDAFLRGGPRRDGLEVVYEWVIAFVWGLAMTGLVAAFWPLALANHEILARIDRRRSAGIAALLLAGSAFFAAPPASAGEEEGRAPDFAPGEIVTLARADNDLLLTSDDRGSRAALPLEIEERIRGFLETKYSEYAARGGDDGIFIRLGQMCRTVTRVAFPDGRILFAPFVSFGCGDDSLFFFVYDPDSDAVTSEPPSLHVGWMTDGRGILDSLLERPIVRFEDTTGDGRSELIVKRRAHNGTMVNAVVEWHYHVGSDAKLTEILALETLTLSPFGDATIEREVVGRGSGWIEIEATAGRRLDSAVRKGLGRVLLATAGEAHPFGVVSLRAERETIRGFPARPFVLGDGGLP